MSTAEELLREAAELPDGPEAQPIKRITYTHEAIIDLLIEHPFADGLWLSTRTGYTRSWLSTLMCCDAFQAKLAERREKIIDPRLKLSLEEQARGLFAVSLDTLRQKFNQPAANIPDQLAIQTFSATAKALGYGNRTEPTAQREDTAAGLIRHADNLVALLRRERAKADREEVVIDVPNEGQR